MATQKQLNQMKADADKAKAKEAMREESVKFFMRMHGLSRHEAIEAVERYELMQSKLQHNLAATKPKGFETK